MIKHDIILRMVGESRNRPIQLLINYWEMRPAAMGASLDELVQKGLRSVTTFIPWQVFESDISHRLMKFLQAANDRKLNVSLIVTPEVGIHYLNSGIPKDLFSAKNNTAVTSDKRAVVIHDPPNVFSMPSLYSPDVAKRFQGYISRLQGFLADLERAQPAMFKRLELVLTGSFWKYYRSARQSACEPFAGIAGDFSKGAALEYRRAVERFYSQKEFMDPHPSAANRWKVRAFDGVNRKWFYQKSEDEFRLKALVGLQKRDYGADMSQIELYTPESDPGNLYSRMFQSLCSGPADFYRLSHLVDEMSHRINATRQEKCSPFVHWSSLGGFSSLSKAEKQFLIFKSMLLMGGRGGGFLLDYPQWNALGNAFKSHVEVMARSLDQKKLQLNDQAIYLTPHLWSDSSSIWTTLKKQLGYTAAITSSIDYIEKNTSAQLLMVDPSFIFTKDNFSRLLSWASRGRVLVLPRSSLYTHAARAALEKTMGSQEALDINIGVKYKVTTNGNGKLVVFDMPENKDITFDRFVQSQLSLAEIKPVCEVSDARITAIPLSKGLGNGRGMGLFVLNGTSRSVTADVLFPNPVTITDLAVSMAEERPFEPEPAEMASRFTLTVPKFGILPLGVEGLNRDVDERLQAALVADSTRNAALDAVQGELPGFVPGDELGGNSMEKIWN